MPLRPALRGDLDSIGAVAAAVAWDSYPGLLRPATIARFLAVEFSPAALARRLLRGGVAVAEGPDGIEGFIDAVPDAEALAVTAIAVVPRQRRRGVGRALLAEAERRAAALPLHTDLVLGETTEVFYERVGFIPGEVIPHRRYGEDVVVRRWWREAAGMRRVHH